MVGLLFFFTGMAIALYLNQPPTEPRERDYTFAASFYAFSIWIGMEVMAISALLQKITENKLATASLASTLCLSVPIVMATEGWDDHDCSDRYFSLDSAKNLLDSCAPNAILFTHADNDTYPLWYVQEVEGHRTDVRVAVMSFLNTDWYIEQITRPAYEAEPWPLSLGMDSYRQGTNDYLPYLERPQVVSGIDLKQFMQLVKQNHPALQAQYGTGTILLTFPTKDFYLPIDKRRVLTQGVVATEKQEKIVDQLHLKAEASYLEKRYLVVLDLLSSQNWDRPIYFSTNIPASDYVGLHKYSQLEGLAYRIVPVQADDEQGYINKEILYDNLINKFSYRNLDSPTIYLDQNYLNFAASMREKFALLAKAYVEAGDKEKALEVINFCFKKMPLATIPSDFHTPKFIPLLTAIGETE